MRPAGRHLVTHDLEGLDKKKSGKVNIKRPLQRINFCFLFVSPDRSVHWNGNMNVYVSSELYTWVCQIKTENHRFQCPRTLHCYFTFRPDGIKCTVIIVVIAVLEYVPVGCWRTRDTTGMVCVRYVCFPCTRHTFLYVSRRIMFYVRPITWYYTTNGGGCGMPSGRVSGGDVLYHASYAGKDCYRVWNNCLEYVFFKRDTADPVADRPTTSNAWLCYRENDCGH